MANPAFTVHTSNALELLLDDLAARLARDPLPPLCDETILVPSHGMAKWLQLQLAARHGIAASLRMPYPDAFLRDLAARAAHARGEPAPAGSGAFDRSVLVFRLFRLLGEPALQRKLGPAARYCKDDQDQRRRFQLSQRLAGCFDLYQLYRDDLLLAWARGENVPDHPQAPWQAALWRELLADAGCAQGRPESARAAPAARGQLPFADPPAATAAAGPAPAVAHRLEQLRSLLADPEFARAVLPERVFVFGASTLPPAVLALLQQIGDHVPVTVYVPSPTPHYTGDLRRGPGNAADPAGHALLAQLGGESREFLDLLLDADPAGRALEPLEFRDPGTGCALHALQSDILHVRARGTEDAPPLLLRAEDESLRLHGCHSPMREMEVVRDQILHALEHDPSLEPHDVLVLVPDIDRYAPYAHAVFGPLAKELPYRVADRDPASELPVVATLLAVVELARARVTPSEVLHLLEEPSLQRTFGLAAADLPVLREWTERTRIRWGVDGAFRERTFRVPADDGNTWQEGLQRLLLGVATGPIDGLVFGILPAADATDGRAELLGRFAEFLRATFALLSTLTRPHTLPVWADELDRTLELLFTARAPAELAGVAHLRAATSALRTLAVAARLREEVHPAVLLDWLRQHLHDQGGARGFLGGALTIAAQQPMRAVPIRMLCLCGLEDASFPRRDQPLPFDLVAAARRLGDRSAREDDRQWFLEALLSARDRLCVTWVARSAKDDSPCAPSTVLADLQDLLAVSFVPQGGARAARAIDLLSLQHPLQAFSERYRDGSDPRLFTYAGGEAPPRHGAGPFVTEATPHGVPAETAPHRLELDELLDFWRNPARYWLRNVLQIRLPESTDRELDTEPFVVHNLDKWKVQDAAARRAMSGASPDQDPLARARADGILPAGEIGRIAFAEAADETEMFLARVRPHVVAGRQSLAVRGPDFELHAELDRLGPTEQVLWRIARLKDKDALRGFLRHAFLCAARSQGAAVPTTTRVIGKDKTLRYQPMAGPVEYLSMLVRGFRAGRTTALPFFEHGSREYTARLRSRNDPQAAVSAARAEWSGPEWGDDGTWRPPGDGEDPWNELCWRDRDPFALPEFATWAVAVWDPALTWVEDGA